MNPLAPLVVLGVGWVLSRKAAAPSSSSSSSSNSGPWQVNAGETWDITIATTSRLTDSEWPPLTRGSLVSYTEAQLADGSVRLVLRQRFTEPDTINAARGERNNGSPIAVIAAQRVS